MSNYNQSSISDWIIEKNNQFILFNKPSGIPVQNDKTGDMSLLQLAESYCKHPLFLSHRIDRPASGIVLFAKNKNALKFFNLQFQEHVVGKSYLAICEKGPIEKSGTLINYLKKNGRTNKSAIFEAPTDGAKKAILEYEIVQELDRYFVLSINLTTGRQHQIRAQLAHLGCPIKGDVKYGFRRKNPDRSIDLHAWKLSFKHPVNNEKLIFEASLPESGIWEFVKINS